MGTNTEDRFAVGRFGMSALLFSCTKYRISTKRDPNLPGPDHPLPFSVLCGLLSGDLHRAGRSSGTASGKSHSVSVRCRARWSLPAVSGGSGRVSYRCQNSGPDDRPGRPFSPGSQTTLPLLQQLRPRLFHRRGGRGAVRIPGGWASAVGYPSAGGTGDRFFLSLSPPDPYSKDTYPLPSFRRVSRCGERGLSVNPECLCLCDPVFCDHRASVLHPHPSEPPIGQMSLRWVSGDLHRDRQSRRGSLFSCRFAIGGLSVGLGWMFRPLSEPSLLAGTGSSHRTLSPGKILSGSSGCRIDSPLLSFLPSGTARDGTDSMHRPRTAGPRDNRSMGIVGLLYPAARKKG